MTSKIKAYIITVGDKQHEFKRDEAKVVQIEPEYVLVTADVKLADGTILDAILDICTADQGEHWGTYFLTDEGIVSQSDEDFLAKLKKTRKEVFPYHYKYRAAIPCEDIHVGADGWSL